MRISLAYCFLGFSLLAPSACPESQPAPTDVVSDTQDVAEETEDVPVVTHRVTVFINGTGLGTVTSDPPGIDCGNVCSADFIAGQEVTLTAAPALGNAFEGFSGDACSGLNACTFTVSEAVDVPVTWGPHALTVTTAAVLAPADGTVGDDRANSLASSSFGTLFAAQSGQDSTLLRVSPDNGTGSPEVMWALKFGPPESSCPTLALDSNAGARAFVAGRGDTGTNLDPNGPTAVDGAATFLASYSDGGTLNWSQVATAGCPKAVAATEAVVAWTGEVSGAGASIGTPLNTRDDATSWVVAVHDAVSGAPIWSRAFGIEAFDVARGRAVAVDEQGGVVAAGRVVNTGEIDLGGGPLPAGSSVVIARFDDAGGHVWSRNYGGIDTDVTLLELLSDGTIGIAGVERVGAEEFAFVSKLSAAGDTLWTTYYTYAPEQAPEGLTEVDGKDLVVVGWRYIPTDGLSNLTLTRLAADGGVRWREELGSQGGEERGFGITPSSTGWWLGGWFSGNSPWNIGASIPPIALTAVDGQDAMLLHVEEASP